MSNSDERGFIIKLRGLPFSTTVDDVVDFLSSVRIVGGSEGVHLTEIRPGRASGECFVEVQSQHDIDEALKKDKAIMGTRYIEVFSTDRADMNWCINRLNGTTTIPEVSDNVGVVKLRGLPYSCSKDDILKFFDGYSVLTDGVHIMSEWSGRPSGEAFVLFADKEVAQDAMERDREKIGHRYIELFLSSVDEMKYFHSREDGGGRMHSERGHYRPGPYDRGDRYGRYGSRGRGGRGGSFSSSRSRGSSHSVHMRGLPFKATQQDIAYRPSFGSGRC